MKGVRFITTMKGIKFNTVAVIILYTFVIMCFVYAFTTQPQSAWIVGIAGSLIVLCLVMLCALLWSSINLAYVRGKLDMITKMNEDSLGKEQSDEMSKAHLEGNKKFMV